MKILFCNNPINTIFILILMSYELNNISSIFASISRPPSPPSEIQSCKRPILTMNVDQNSSRNSCYSTHSGGYSFSENLNGNASSFNQGGGGHSNFFATAKSWR